MYVKKNATIPKAATARGRYMFYADKGELGLRPLIEKPASSGCVCNAFGAPPNLQLVFSIQMSCGNPNTDGDTLMAREPALVYPTGKFLTSCRAR
jgi:hypothetical protein